MLGPLRGRHLLRKAWEYMVDPASTMTLTPQLA